jgi:hemoglobin/transferrin/lactoferrin receptor protein
MARAALLLTILAISPAPALAQASPPIAPEATLPPVAVTATRGAKPLDQIPATVSVIDQLQLERMGAVRPSDAVRYEPGVTVGNQPARGGQTSYVIRGIGDNRVLVLQDGLRIQDFPSSNVGAGNYTRNFVDLDTVRRVEIVRGPASALYGSDALGGVVNYILKDPGDYLDGTGRNLYVSGKLGYNGSDNSVYQTATAAVRTGPADLLLLFTHRDGHETRANGSIRPNPQVYQANTLLARGVIRATDTDTIRLTGEYSQRRTATTLRTEEINTAPAGFTPGSNVLSSHGRDTTQRGALTLDWEHDAPFLFVDSVRARLSFSRLERREQTDLRRATYSGLVAPTVANRRRLSDFAFDQNLYVADIQARSRVSLFGIDHALTYGTTLEVTQTTRPRDRREINLVTGTSTATVAGESYPSKNLPDTTTTQFGAYLQDEFTIGRLELTPALRVDFYDLKPHPDAASRRSAGALVVKPLSEVALSPKLGAVYRFNETYSAYGQYARGFRAPPYDSTNFAFTNTAFGYQILPNADLKSETSDGVEFGLRGRYASGSWQVNAFYNHYSNFIDTRVVAILPGGVQQFQYVNVADVRIWGAEARGDYRLNAQWSLKGAVAWARGENARTGKPIDSVDPLKLTTGVSWKHESGFGVDAVMVNALRHDRVSDASYFKSPAYTTFDLMFHYNVKPGLTLNGGIFNVTDTKYFVSQDVNGLARTSPLRDLYAQPGRYFALNATVRW